MLIFGLISLLINNCLQEARATIEAKEAKANEYCATLLNNNKILKTECERLRDGLELQKKACQKIANEAANLRADRTKLRNEVANLNRLKNMSYETRDKALRLLKELVEDKKKLQEQCENLTRENIKVVKNHLHDLKSAIVAQVARHTAQGEVKKLKDDIASSNIVIHDLEKQVEELHAKGNAAVEGHAKSK